MRELHSNMRYMWQQWCALWGNISVMTKLICSIVLLVYCASWWDHTVRVLSIRPQKLMPPEFWIWTVFTYCFLELHFWEVIVDWVTMGLCGKLIEPLWGWVEMLTFFGLINIAVGFFSAMYYYFLYMCTFNPHYLFDVNIHGLAGYIASVTVAVKQVMPDHVLVKTPIGKIMNRNIPLLVLLLSLLLWLIGLLEGTYPVMFLMGLLVSWTYLRFYQSHNNGTRGDMADNFNFASFFPTVLQPGVSVLANSVFSALVSMKICKRPIRKYDVGAPTAITISLPGTEPHDAERRRQMALKALSERLSRGDKGTVNWPNIEVEDRSSTSTVTPSPSPSPHPPSLHKPTPPSVTTKEEEEQATPSQTKEGLEAV